MRDSLRTNCRAGERTLGSMRASRYLALAIAAGGLLAALERSRARREHELWGAAKPYSVQSDEAPEMAALAAEWEAATVPRDS